MGNMLVTSVVENRIAALTLNRPERMNAINAELIEALLCALKEINSDVTVRVIILKGAGKAFCSGADLNEEDIVKAPLESVVRAQNELLQEITRQILYSDKIVIGAIHGWAVGAGLEWAINCDFPIWAESTKGFFPEAQWGLSVTGAITALLPAMVGPIKARELLLLGEKHTAEQFQTLGVAWKVVPDDCLLNEAQVLAERLAKLPSRSLRDIKKGINLGSYSDLEKTLAYEVDCNVAAMLDPQTLENIKTFSSR
ncbi:MAG: enoyl-CoA hydratase/carnithine racemase [Kiritimatiellia bacterium]|jgi:enoyl-CoA hydratase/carnithine racemase